MRPRTHSSLRSSLGEAVQEGYRSARQNFAAMSALLAAMALVVAIYYFWPAGKEFLSRYGAWQDAGGIFRVGLIAGFAGGILSELCVIYICDGGRWNGTHLENMVFRFVVFFIGGIIVSKFYQCQAYWFGDAVSWRILLPKILVDQFIFSVIWSTTYQTLTFRWQALRYSGSRLWSELDRSFLVQRMLPVLVTNWMFWIPGVTLVYSMPLILQMPLNIFATAIWSLLLAGLAKSARAPESDLGPALVLTGTNPVAERAELN